MPYLLLLLVDDAVVVVVVVAALFRALDPRTMATLKKGYDRSLQMSRGRNSFIAGPLGLCLRTILKQSMGNHGRGGETSSCC